MNEPKNTDGFTQDRLFVYGTLRKGRSHHGVLSRLRAQWLGNGFVQGILFDLGRYPGALPDHRPAAKVYGEVYRLPSPGRALKVLDAFEGCDLMNPQFLRAEARVMLADGRKLKVWIYWVHNLGVRGRRIVSGDYRSDGVRSLAFARSCAGK